MQTIHTLPFARTAAQSDSDGLGDREHRVAIGTVTHPSGDVQPIVEVYENHDGKEETRRFDLSTAVHVLLNLRPDEEFEIEGRKHSAPEIQDSGELPVPESFQTPYYDADFQPSEAHGWLYEDQLPTGYPYDKKFPHSRIVDGVRMFPPVEHPAEEDVYQPTDHDEWNNPQ